MANIHVVVEKTIADGFKLKFRTPCDSTVIEGLEVKYPAKDGIGTLIKKFVFKDAHGAELSGKGNLFVSGVMIEVLLDVTHGVAYIQNADTNSYVESIKGEVQRLEDAQRQFLGVAGKAVEECEQATNETISATETIKEATNTLVLTHDDIVSGGYVEALKELKTGGKFSMWVGTSEEYKHDKASGAIPDNAFCIVTDDTTHEDLVMAIEELNSRADKAEEDIAGNKEYTDETVAANKEYNKTRYKSMYLDWAQQIPDNADLNDYLTVGEWFCPTNVRSRTLLNCPTEEAFRLTIEDNGASTSVVAGEYRYCRQTITTISGVKIYRRVWAAEGSTDIEYHEWEWENPPMVEGDEYRTTERYNGKPVYAMGCVYTGYIAAGECKTVATIPDIANCTIIDIYGTHNDTLEIDGGTDSVTAQIGNTDFKVSVSRVFGNVYFDNTTGSSVSGVYATIKYIRN